MNEEPSTPQRHERRRRFRPGCLLWIVGTIVVAAAVIVAIGETFDQGDKRGSSNTLNAGPAEQYARSDLTPFENEHIFIIRLDDGSFLALYDRSTKQQELGTDCRVRYDETAQLLALMQLPGFTGAFVSECDGNLAMWRADGTFASGADYGDLDRLSTSIDSDGDLIVDLSSRSCTRSRGVNGLPPYDPATCGAPD